MIRIKICGLTRIEDIEAVNRCLPEYIGFVFAASRRQVTPAQARLLKARLDPRIQAIGVFVNEPIANIASIFVAGTIDVVQLHGDEDGGFMQSLRRQVACPIIKAIRVRSREQVLQAQLLPCDMLLLDACQEGQYGGSGQTFDRTLIPELQKPFLLAGGLNADNIRQAIEECHPWGVDISSGVETRGAKDEAKIREIIAAVRESGSTRKDRGL